MTESDWQEKLQKEDRLLPIANELKVTKTKRLNFKQFAPHQIEHLQKVKHTRWTYKIQDVGKAKKPFDSVTFDHDPAWCVCIWDETGGVYAIDIDVFWKEIKTSKEKSLKEERAMEIGIRL